MTMETKSKTVKELTGDIKNLLEGEFPYVWVKGEVGPVKVHSSGHRYFSLKEADCVINAICWRGTALSTELEEGMLVECYSKVTIFGGRSSYQIIVREVKQVSKQGDILLELEKLKKKLVEEGVFNLKSESSIPKFPNKIAILTSPTGAVLHDMLHRINDRFPCLEVLFFPIAVQGNDSKNSILKGLDLAEKSGVDCVILARGGGSLEDLWIFNNEEVVRKVASLKLPIISAIGHETDTTLVDYAANLRAPTPTAAAELAMPDKNELKSIIKTAFSNSCSLLEEKLQSLNTFLHQFDDNQRVYLNVVENFMQKVDNLNMVFFDIVKSKIQDAEVVLAQEDSIDHIIDNMLLDVSNKCNYIKEVALVKVSEATSIFEQGQIFINEKENDLKEKVILTEKTGKKLACYKDILALKEDDFYLNFIDGSVLVKK